MKTRSSNRRLTRRHVLKTGAAAIGAGTGLLNGPPLLDAQSAQAPAQAPGLVTGTQTGRPFRGLVRHANTLDVQEMRLLPIDPRQVVIRSLAVAPCYTIVRGALSTSPARRAEVPNHCGFGVVEAVGPMVKRVQIGDRVVVAGTSQCGQCYQSCRAVQTTASSRSSRTHKGSTRFLRLPSFPTARLYTRGQVSGE
jgi:hypothetical protein